MLSRWTQHLSNEDEKLRFKSSVLGSKVVLQRLGDILDEMDKGAIQAELSPSNYDKPSWAYKQAHNNGLRHAISLIKQLTTLDLKETNDRPLSTARPTGD